MFSKIKRRLLPLAIAGAGVGALLMPSAALAAGCDGHANGHEIAPVAPYIGSDWSFPIGGFDGGTLSAQVCVAPGFHPRVDSENFTPFTNGSGATTQVDKSAYWDTADYGGSENIWANVTETVVTSGVAFGIGSGITEVRYIDYRIYVSPNGALHGWARLVGES